MAHPVRTLILATLALLAIGGVALAQPKPEFKLGFKLLADQIPDVVGEPLEDEHHDPLNGDALQQTTRGLMVWRKADNWTAFTDGTRSWINGPYGVQSRPNEERFPWEKDRPAPRPTGQPRVNVYPTPGAAKVDWSRASIFWFGRATDRENYVDVRVAYDSQALHVFATVVDYYFWYDESGGSDPRDCDALALHISTGSSRGSSPQPGDFLFVSGFRHWPTENDDRWHRQARGDGSNWDYSWSPAPTWKDSIGLRYGKSGSNDNSDRDAGWATTFTIPWATLGLSGPPAAGTSWGLGMLLYDRDEAEAAGLSVAQWWPADLLGERPDSWGLLAFDPPPYPRLRPAETGVTVIRRGLDGAVVSDAYVGGGGKCRGGVFGDADKPHPTGDLFVQNQSDVADFPCFSKSYLKFDLSGVPPGKRIVSATLKLHSFGGSDPSQALPSDIHLFTVAEDWDEATLTWNNAPAARENVSVARVDVLPEFPGWPGVPFVWDATQAVAEAYAEGKPANLALYSADTAYHSGKFFVSSHTGDWNAVARPTLTVVWGEESGN